MARNPALAAIVAPPKIRWFMTLAVLRCDECEAIDAGRAFGWVAMLGLEDDRETETVEVFCPDCAAREFEYEPVHRLGFDS